MGVRKRASIVVIEAEGNNKTEPLYFKKFNSKTRDDLYELLLPNIDKAIDAAKRLGEYNLNDNRKPHTALFQPSTEVYKVIETVRSIEKQ